MSPRIIPSLLIFVSTAAMAGEPSPTVPNRSGVGPLISPTIDFRAYHTPPQPTGPTNIWIGNPGLTRVPRYPTPSLETMSPCPSETESCDVDPPSFDTEGE